MNKILELIRHSFSSGMARNAAYLFAGQGAGYLLQAAYFIILARLLEPLQYGIFAGVFALTYLLAPYSPVGTGMVLLRYVSSDRNVFAVYWGNILLVTFVTGGVMTVFFYMFGPHILSPVSTPLIPFAAIANCIFGQVGIQSSYVFQAHEQMRLAAAMNLLTYLIRTITVVGLWVTLHHATALQWAIASMLVSGLAAAISIGKVTLRFGLPKFTLKVFMERGMEGFGYSVANSTASIYNDLDKTMLSHYGMNFANGIYTTAYRVVDFATVPIMSICTAAMPRMFQIGKNGLAQTAHLSFRLLRRALLIAALLAVGMFLCAPLLPKLVGKGFVESLEALRWLCLIPLFRAVHQIVGSALTGAGLQRYRTAMQFTAAAFNFALNLWLIPAFSWRGAAWSSLATDGGLGLISLSLVAILSRKSKESLELAN